MIGLEIGSGLTGGALQVSSDPDGTLTAQRGTLAVDTTTGITWKNRSGGTRWDPVHIPETWGRQDFFDFDNLAYSVGNIGSGSNAETTATLTGRIAVRRLSAAAAGVDGVVLRSFASAGLGYGRYVFRGAISIPTLSDGSNRLVARFGGGDQTAFGDHTDGVYLECDLATNGSNNWFLVGANNGSRTRVDTGIAPTAGIFQNVEIRANALGTLVAAEIDGVAAANTLSTNIPTTGARGFYPMCALFLKSLGAGALTLDVDWMSYYLVLSTARA